MGARARPAVLRRAGGTSTAVRTTSTSRSQRPTTAGHTAPLWPAPASPVIAAAVHASISSTRILRTSRWCRQTPSPHCPMRSTRRWRPRTPPNAFSQPKLLRDVRPRSNIRPAHSRCGATRVPLTRVGFAARHPERFATQVPIDSGLLKRWQRQIAASHRAGLPLMLR